MGQQEFSEIIAKAFLETLACLRPYQIPYHGAFHCITCLYYFLYILFMFMFIFHYTEYADSLLQRDPAFAF